MDLSEVVIDNAAIEADLLQELEQLELEVGGGGDGGIDQSIDFESENDADVDANADADADQDSLHERLLEVLGAAPVNDDGHYESNDGSTTIDPDTIDPDTILSSLPGFDQFQASSVIVAHDIPTIVEDGGLDLGLDLDLGLQQEARRGEEEELQQISSPLDNEACDEYDRAATCTTADRSKPLDQNESECESMIDGTIAMRVPIDTNINIDIVPKRPIQSKTYLSWMQPSNSSHQEENTLFQEEMDLNLDLNLNLDYLRSKVEEEAKEELFLRRRQRNEIRRKREIQASKERVNIVHMNQMANRLQDFIRRFLMGRRTTRTQRYRTSIGIMFRILITSMEQRYFDIWMQTVVVRGRAAERLVHWITVCMDRTRHRRMNQQKGIETMDDVMKRCQVRLGFVNFQTHLACQRERMRSSIVIQCQFRIRLAKRKRNRIQDARRWGMSIVVQRHVRGYFVRKWYLSQQVLIRQQRDHAAKTMQRFYRTIHVRKMLVQVKKYRYSHQDEELETLMDDEEDFFNELRASCGDNDDGDDDTVDDIMSMSCLDWKPKLPNLPTRSVSNQNTTESAHPNNDVKSSETVKKPISIGTAPETVERSPVLPERHEKLMNEWKITDERVIQAMIKRKAKMTQGKRREAHSKRNANPLHRFERLMKNVCKGQGKIGP